jgi:predicted DNA-binding mobile mystery protein A
MMRAQDRFTARRNLDKKLAALQNVDLLVRPSRGWIKAIREALGMTTTQLGKRLGVTQSRVIAIEQAEVKKSITLNSLEKAAQAMDCQLVYVLLPKRPLEKQVREQAENLSRKQIEATRHTMTLEAQAIDKADEEELRKRLVEKILEKAGSELWENNK